MQLRIEETPKKIILYFTAPKVFDESQISEIHLGLRDICRRKADLRKKLVIDFRDVEVLDSGMMGKLVLLKKAALTEEVNLRFRNVTGQPLEVFRITRLDRVFRLSDEDEDDIESSGAPVPLPVKPRSDSGHAKPT